MARTAIKVDLELLKRLIQEVENDGPLENQFILYYKVAELYNSNVQHDTFPAITHSIVKLRILSCNISIKTQPGKKGRTSFSSQVTRTSRSEKFKNNPKILEAFRQMRKDFPTKQKWMDKVEAGSLKYMMKLKCFECSGNDDAESKHCSIINCPLWPALLRNSQHQIKE